MNIENTDGMTAKETEAFIRRTAKRHARERTVERARDMGLAAGQGREPDETLATGENVLILAAIAAGLLLLSGLCWLISNGVAEAVAK